MGPALAEIGRQVRDVVNRTRDAIEPALIEKEMSIAEFEQMLSDVVDELNREAIPDFQKRRIMVDKKVEDSGRVRYAFHFVADRRQFNLITNPYPSGGDVETFFLIVWMPKSPTSDENYTQTIHKDRAKRRLQTTLQKYLRATGNPAFGWNAWTI